MTADQRALVWLAGAAAMLVGAIVLGWQVTAIVAGFLLTDWSRR